MTLAGDIVAAIRSDPDALEELRDLLAREVVTTSSTPAFTVATLARELGRSERSVRAAIARGELDAVKRGRGWVISGAAVAAWATAPGPSGRSSSPRARRRAGVMAQALSPRPGPARASRP